MLSRNDYIFITRRLISKHISGTKLCKRIINDEDLFGELLGEIMKADWMWDGRGTIEGYRKQRFLWALGTFKEKFHHPKNRFFQCENFDSTYDKKASINDNNIFYEEFVRDINCSSILTEKEKQSLRSVFVELNEPTEVIKNNVTRGLHKLKHDYKIFNPRRIRNHSKKNS